MNLLLFGISLAFVLYDDLADLFTPKEHVKRLFIWGEVIIKMIQNVVGFSVAACLCLRVVRLRQDHIIYFGD